MQLINTIYTALQKKLRNLVFSDTDKIAFAHRGKNVWIDHTLLYSGEENISIGDDCNIGVRCIMYATKAKITIGRCVLVSPNVTFVTGEHRTDIIGEYMRYVGDDQKLPHHDKDITIEDDVWIGSNVTILKGVTIGRGSIIHAGAVITKRVPPYTVYINDQVKVARFSPEEVAQHEKLLYEKYGVTYPPYKPKKGSGFFR